MTRDKGRGSEPEDDAPDRDALASAETRVLPEGEAGFSDTEGADSEAATVLAAEDDRTQLVSRSSESPGVGSTPAEALKATRVLEPAASPPLPVDVATEAETRVLDATEDKTSPPAVTPASDAQSPSAPTPASDAQSPFAPTPASDRQSPPAPTPIDPSRGLVPGTVLFGEYEIVNVLGVGGMGEVYRARHRRLDEHRAIKVMHAELSNKKGASEFFYREAKALLAVRHPAVVHCHDLLSDDDGRVYLIMEMIEGIPLSKKMNDGPLSPDDVAMLGARVAHGLSAAHRKGVIHRDVSPDNIVLPNGHVREAKLIDFGIAKILEEGEGTIIDGFKGKLSYASPEQLGFFGGKMDGSSDFYSLGLVLVAAALGRPMSMGTTVMEAVDARRGFAALPDEIPVGLRSAIQPLLALDPKDRPKYVDRLFVVPGGIEGGTDPGGYAHAPSASTAESTKRSGDRTPLLVGAGAVVAVAAAAGFYFLTGEATQRAPLQNPVVAELSETVSEAEPTPTPTQTATVEEATAAPVAVAVAPAKPAVRRVTASDRIRIIGLLSNAKLALDENRLMSPANDNAYDRYRSVLALDPSNTKARTGLSEVAGRYLRLSSASAAKGDLDQARVFLDRARKADATHSGIPGTEALLAN
jgi:serine/threonine protein kinase